MEPMIPTAETQRQGGHNEATHQLCARFGTGEEEITAVDPCWRNRLPFWKLLRLAAVGSPSKGLLLDLFSSPCVLLLKPSTPLCLMRFTVLSDKSQSITSRMIYV